MLLVEPSAPEDSDERGKEEGEGDDDEDEAEDLALERRQGGSAFRG